MIFRYYPGINFYAYFWNHNTRKQSPWHQKNLIFEGRFLLTSFVKKTNFDKKKSPGRSLIETFLFEPISADFSSFRKKSVEYQNWYLMQKFMITDQTVKTYKYTTLESLVINLELWITE